jgi:hypothetical protein
LVAELEAARLAGDWTRATHTVAALAALRVWLPPLVAEQTEGAVLAAGEFVPLGGREHLGDLAVLCAQLAAERAQAEDAARVVLLLAAAADPDASQTTIPARLLELRAAYAALSWPLRQHLAPVLPDALRPRQTEAMRELLLAAAEGDRARMDSALAELGWFLPPADLDRARAVWRLLDAALLAHEVEAEFGAEPSALAPLLVRAQLVAGVAELARLAGGDLWPNASASLSALANQLRQRAQAEESGASAEEGQWLRLLISQLTRAAANASQRPAVGPSPATDRPAMSALAPRTPREGPPRVRN